MATLYDRIAETARAIRAQWPELPVAILAGPAFKDLPVEMRPFSGRESPVPLVRTRLAGHPVVMPADPACGDATFAVRVAAALDAQTLVVAPEAWGLNPRMRPGDLVVFTDHVNATGANPLTGLDDPRLGPCFLDMSEPYDRALQAEAEAAARAQGLTAHRGVYLDAPGCLPGTDDDRRAMRALGAAAAGSGGVAEVIVGVQAGLRVLGLALLSPDGPSMASAGDRADTRVRVASRSPSPLFAVVERCIREIESRI